jgi:hypothetical protein
MTRGTAVRKIENGTRPGRLNIGQAKKEYALVMYSKNTARDLNNGTGSL